jgi:hypothetical protein
MLNRNVMIVAHPDDEVLWGGANFLEVERNILVVCLTNGANKTRRSKFESVMQLYQVDFKIFDFPDNGNVGFTEDESLEICQEIDKIVNQDCVEKVVTHGPLGEYGHIHHRQVSDIVTRTLQDSSKLYFFDFELSKQNSISIHPFSNLTTKALQIYFEYMPNKDVFSLSQEILLSRPEQGLLALLNKVKRKFLSRLPLKRLSQNLSHSRDFERFLPSTQLSYYKYLELTKFAKLTKAGDYLGQSSPPRNRLEMLLNNLSLYFGYIDRLYILLKHLPECHGRTLSVGCHEFNKFDHLGVPNPLLYETIDLEESYAAYGSPFKHHVGDFLSFNPINQFDDVILFGVLGIPHDAVDSENYTMFNNENEVISKANQILKKGGRLLLGPDISLETRMTKQEAILYWHSLHRVNKVLCRYFSLEFSLTTASNTVLVYRKVV